MSNNDFSNKIYKAKSILTDPEKLQHFLKKNRKELMYWVTQLLIPPN